MKLTLSPELVPVVDDSWNRERSNEDLRAFIDSRLASAALIDIEVA